MKIIVVAMDSFKGCLSSAQAADAVEKGVLPAVPDAVAAQDLVSKWI